VKGYRNPGDAHEIELLLRFRISANNARGYEVLWGQDGVIAIVRWNGPLGDYTSLLEGPNIGAAVDGDTLRAEIVGTVVKVYKNGTLVATGPSNSTWTDGQPGMGFWPLPGATLASYGWKSYLAGNVGKVALRGGGTVPLSRMALAKALHLSVTPDPFCESIRINANQTLAGISRLRIIEVSGAVMRDVFVSSTELDAGVDVNGLSCGFYIAEVEGYRSAATRFIVK